MFSIFNSSKTLVIEAKADPEIVMEHFRARIGKDTVMAHLRNAFSFGGEFVGKVKDRNVEVRFISTVRNSLQPTMMIHVETAPGGSSVILTRYRTSLAVKVFLTLWISGALVASVALILSGKGGNVALFALAFPLFGLFLMVLMRLIARRDEDKLEGLVYDVVKKSEGK